MENNSNSNNKGSTDSCESQPPSLTAIRELFNEFNVPDTSDEICTRVLDVLYRHAFDVIEEAKAVSHHAGKNKIDDGDMELAINSINEGLMFSPPYRDQLLAYAEKNNQPLPSIRPSCGIRLPNERFNLTAPNYSLLPDSTNEKSKCISDGSVMDTSTAVHIPSSIAASKGLYRQFTPSSGRTINVGSSVHVIAPTGTGPSMIRVHNVQSMATHLSGTDPAASMRTLPASPSVHNVLSLNRRLADNTQ